jgi:hypothetical protein
MFGVIFEKQTYRNLGYLLSAFPLGLIYFVLLVTGMSLGLGLSIIWVGIPILMIMLMAVQALGRFERELANKVLNVEIVPPVYPEGRSGFIGQFKTYGSSATTWQAFIYLLLKFPFGLLSFCAAIVSIALILGLLTAPLVYLIQSAIMTSLNVDYSGWMLYLPVDGHFDPVKMLLLMPCIPVGVLLIPVLLSGLNGLATGWAAFANAMLGREVKHEYYPTSWY